jgi:hypothetical protein
MNDIFDAARNNDVESINYLLNSGTNPNDQDDFGRTALHICCTYGSTDAAALLLSRYADHTLQDYESGWTPLHRSLYFGHLKLTLLLLKAGAVIGDELTVGEWDIEVQSKRQIPRSIRNYKKWKSPIDHDGHSPLDLLSMKLSSGIFSSSHCNEVQCFGKSDFYLGISLPNAEYISRPRHVKSLDSLQIVSVYAAKYHSAALARDGSVYTWGYGRGGRLGHANEITYQLPQKLSYFNGIIVTHLAISENHMLAIVENGEVYSWGSNSFGQLGHGKPSTTSLNTSTCLQPRRIEKLLRCRVLGIACGNTHSLCFTSEGELYGWGSNKHGQLGAIKASGNGYATSTHTPLLIKFLQQPRVTKSNNNGSITSNYFKIIEVCASNYSSLVLCRSMNKEIHFTQRVNDVYQWGNGTFSPIKINLSGKSNWNLSYDSANKSHGTPIGSSASSLLVSQWSGGNLHPVDITHICAGNNYSVGLSSHGHVYTWGLGSDQLGHGSNSVSSHVSSPRILESLLPENGGKLQSINISFYIEYR